MRSLWPALVLLGFLAFLLWVLTVLLPIAVVEVKFQLRHMANSLGFSDWRSALVPDFRGVGIIGNSSKNKAYGIIIPRLGIDEPVVFNVDPNDEQQYTAALKQGIAHASSTSYPDESGLGYYFAHSSSPGFRSQFNAIFYLLNKLEVDDEVYIWHEQKRYRYLVTHKEIRQPSEVDFLYQKYDGEHIVLQTCWPPGTTKERLLVFAKRDK